MEGHAKYDIFPYPATLFFFSFSPGRTYYHVVLNAFVFPRRGPGTVDYFSFLPRIRTCLSTKPSRKMQSILCYQQTTDLKHETFFEVKSLNPYGLVLLPSGGWFWPMLIAPEGIDSSSRKDRLERIWSGKSGRMKRKCEGEIQ